MERWGTPERTADRLGKKSETGDGGEEGRGGRVAE